MNTVNTQIKIDLEDWNEVEELLRAMESLRLQESKMYYVLIFPVNSRLFILILWDWRSLSGINHSLLSVFLISLKI